jgi:hypothetical protein
VSARRAVGRSRRGRLLAAVAALVVVAGCSTIAPITQDPAQTGVRKGLEQEFGPAYPPDPPTGARIRIDSATASANGRTLRLTFVGGPGYLASDPCSEDYVPWAAFNGGELDVVIVNVEHPEQAQLPVNGGCDAIGYRYRFDLAFERPFLDVPVVDLATERTLDVQLP